MATAPTVIPAAALLALLGVGAPVAAQSPDAALPRVIYGRTEPHVIYGPSSPAPEPPPPRIAPPQAAMPPPPASSALSMGWEPVGPPVWVVPPRWHGRPRPPPVWGRPPAPRIDNRFERPLPPGRYLGTPPGAQRLDPWRR